MLCGSDKASHSHTPKGWLIGFQEEVKPKLSPEEARKQAEELIQKTRARKEVRRSAIQDPLHSLHSVAFEGTTSYFSPYTPVFRVTSGFERSLAFRLSISTLPISRRDNKQNEKCEAEPRLL